MDLADENRDLEEYLLQGDFTNTPPPSFQELLARGDFAKFPILPADSRSLSCSRLVDDNNLLKPLPEDLIGGEVPAREGPASANVPEDEGMNIETSGVTPSSPTCSEVAFGPVAHSSRSRKSREERRSELISQGGRKVR